MGGFALLRTGVLGSAQTSNLAELVVELVGRDLYHALLRVVAMLIYAAGLILTRVIPKYTNWNLKVFSAVVNILCIVLIGFMPTGWNSVIALWPVFFMTSIQWNSFPGARGYVSASIFSTNNYRQLVTGITDYLLDKDREAASRAWFFGGTLTFFHLGVALSCIAIMQLGFHAIWLFTMPSAAVIPFICKERRLAQAAAQK